MLGIHLFFSCIFLLYNQLYKNVAERGEWSSILESARKAYVDRKISQALLQYSFAAELGYEVAQSNVAFLLDRGECLTLSLWYYRKASSRGAYGHDPF